MSLKSNLLLCSALVGVAVIAANPAAAQTNAQIEQLQQQINQLQQQLKQVQQTQAQQTQAQQQAAPAAVYAPAPNGGIQLGGVNLKFGGFIEAASVFRSRNEVADINSDFNGGLPFPNNVQSHERELRFSARQSRISGLITGDVDKDTHLAAYVESDFLGAAVTSNSRESNSYTPRLRHAYGTVDLDNWGTHFLAGQTWSLLTTNTSGIVPRTELIPLTIDAQYIPGFNWTRNPQFRVVENINNWISAGVSVESPQAVFGLGTAVPGANANNTGDTAGLLNSTTSYSNDVAPDVIAKVAFDPGFGHYEIKGVGRFFTDRGADGDNHTTVGGGVGAAATVPVVPKLVDFQASFLAGYGIGRYGSTQLADVTFTSTGALRTIPEVEALVGVLGHPAPGTDVYLYLGYEQADRSATADGIGYGPSTANNTGCLTVGGACGAVTSRVAQATLGVWQDIFKGSYGRIAFGAQGSYTKRYAFSADGGAPYADEAIVMTSFRYYPF